MKPKYLEGPNGEGSSMRLVFWGFALIIGVVWATTSIFHYGVTTTGEAYWQPAIAQLPDNVVELLKIIFTGKVTQAALVESGAIGTAIGILKKKD